MYQSSYPAMLIRVHAAQAQLVEYLARLMPEIDRRTAAGEDVRELFAARKKVRLQELCLADQERRLREAISDGIGLEIQ